MDYRRIYNQLIERGQTRQQGLTKKLLVEQIGYIERHHILPRSMGGTNNSSNLVYLRPEEHYLAHELLVQIYPAEIGLLKALMILSGGHKGGIRNNKLYGWVRRRYIKMATGLRRVMPPWNKGKKGLQTSWNKGQRMSPATYARMPNKKKVSADGIIYDSITAATTAHGLPSTARGSQRCNSDKWHFLEPCPPSPLQH